MPLANNCWLTRLFADSRWITAAILVLAIFKMKGKWKLSPQVDTEYHTISANGLLPLSSLWGEEKQTERNTMLNFSNAAKIAGAPVGLHHKY